MKPIVSVIIPIFNVERYLSKCIDSIINQSYIQLEIILVDDGSPDKSGDICDYYKDADSRIIVIHKINGGLSSARNAGLESATGEYIVFVDSDDWIDEFMIEDMVNTAYSENADIVQCGFRRVNENGSLKNEFRLKDETFIGEEEILKNYFQQNKINVVVWNKLYKRELFLGVRLIENRLYEDIMFTFDILLEVKKLVSIQGVYYNYLQRKQSIMGSSFSPRKLDMIYAGKYVFGKCKNQCPKYLNQSCILLCLYCYYLFYEVRNSGGSKRKMFEQTIYGEFVYFYGIMYKSNEYKKA
ncbi:glycosyltransferase family 2 protein, partial [Paenibacillus phytohabitans]|uniref:glycosyltransferase family 2 protein n=1 Tax=Paenibacillus phytohabitans TaxID=2654978 RepID=UPI003008B0BA